MNDNGERQVTSVVVVKLEWGQRRTRWGFRARTGWTGDRLGGRRRHRGGGGGRGWYFLAKLEQASSWLGLPTGCPAARHRLDSPPSLSCPLKFWVIRSHRPLHFRFSTKSHNILLHLKVDLRPLFSAATSPSRTCEPVTLPFHSINMCVIVVHGRFGFKSFLQVPL